MGLDQYLYKKHYVKNWAYMKPEERTEVTVKKGGEIDKHIKPERIVEISEEIAIWRKSNQIHHWFVENVQNGNDDCKEHEVSGGQLNDLLELIEKVLVDRSLAPELLPTQEGFFFGDTSYDEEYFDDLEYTKSILVKLLAEDGIDGYYDYTSSW